MDGHDGTDRHTASVFDMPHARVTLTPVGPNVEIEVWPKAGQSAYAVVSPSVAILIARQLAELAVAQLEESAATGTAPSTGEGADESTSEGQGGEPGGVGHVGEPGSAALGEEPTGDPPDNIVDLAARRPKRGGASA